MNKLSVFIVFVYFVCGLLCKENKLTKNLYRCRQMCYTKFVQDWRSCMDYEDCKDICITPPNINNYIPEAFSFLCWNSCDETLKPFALNITSVVRQGSLILTNIAWDPIITNSSKQCLVTWEVSGGGLMGNLLTDSSTVELSLWMDTVYHVQVTCKNKKTLTMRRSYQLNIDTRKLNIEISTTTITTSSTPSSPTISSITTPTIRIPTIISPTRIPIISSFLSDANRIKQIQDIFLSKSYSKETLIKDHSQILKDNVNNNQSKDISTIKTTTATTIELQSKQKSILLSPSLSSSSSSSSSSESSSLSSSDHHLPTVIHSKLIAAKNISKLNKNQNIDDIKLKTISRTTVSLQASSSSYLSNNIIYAIIETFIVLLGIIFIYILMRSSRYHHHHDPLLITTTATTSSTSSKSIDKEELLRNEFYPDRKVMHM